MDNPEERAENEVEEKLENSEPDDFSNNSSTDEALKDLPEVLNFIQRLQECIVRQRTLIHKLYQKLKEETSKKVTTTDSSTQTSEVDSEEWSSQESSGNLVEDIKQAAENAVQQTGFVYEATSGMYYDYKTGYYYNAELGLYYDGHNGIYYYFDATSKSFQFHSQVSVQTPLPGTDIEVNIKECMRKRKQEELKQSELIPKKIKPELKEEGECSESSSESENEVSEAEVADKVEVPTCDSNKNNIEVQDSNTNPNITTLNVDTKNDEIANAWPPCLRVVVKETGLDNLLVGSLFIVTCTGGTLGRAGDHAVLIPDINISKHHAKISYGEEKQCYSIVDLGSRNGTYVDGQRISSALQESEPVSLQHGTGIRVGSTNLECHVHLGRETCSDCEPGCAQSKNAASTEQTDNDHETKEARHRSELRRLRKRFGLDKLSTKESAGSLAPGYQDRAEERRKTVGSQNHHAKTETASVHQSIQVNNKGFQMLSKMGWAKGQSLGKDSTKGITEPVLVEQRHEKAGLGADVAHLPVADLKAKKKTEIWKKAQQRFQELDDED